MIRGQTGLVLYRVDGRVNLELEKGEGKAEVRLEMKLEVLLVVSGFDVDRSAEI